MALKVEDKFIIYFAGNNPDMDAAGMIPNIFRDDIDWDYIIEKSLSHGVIAILYQNLENTNGVHPIPTEIKKRLHTIYYANLFRNTMIYKEAGVILQAFNTSDIKVIVLKGVALGKTIYSNDALRPIGDIDLLIKKDDLSMIEKTVAPLGYYIPDHLLSKEFYKKNHFHLSLYKRTAPYAHLELHWDLVDRYNQQLTDIQSIWANAISVNIEGQHAMILSHEDQLIYLCMHLNKHAYLNRVIIDRDDVSDLFFNPMSGNRLIWFIDILKILKGYSNNIEWERIIENSKRWNVEGDVHSVLTLINQLFGQVIPDKIIFAFTPYKSSLLESKIYGKLADNFERINISQGYLSKFFRSKILCTHGDLQLILDILKDLFPSCDFIRKRYSISSYHKTLYLYWIVHSLRRFSSTLIVFFNLLYYTAKKRFLRMIYHASDIKALP